MPRYKKSIHRSALTGIAVFISLLSLLLSIHSYVVITRSMIARYEEQLTHVLDYVEHNIDIPGLYECSQTGEDNAAFHDALRLLNSMIDDYGLLYLYICIPVDDEIGTMINVVSATSAAERAAGEVDLPPLYVSTDGYTREELQPYLDAWRQPGHTHFFETGSVRWGKAHIACRPLAAPDGEPFALLCADLSIQEMQQTVQSYVMVNIALILLIGTLFCLLMILWLQRDVTGPIIELEKYVRRFAEKSHGKKDPALLVFDAPDIHTENEVESLSDAISQMSTDMKDYVENILQAEARANSAEQEALGMSRIAYQDPLTHVRSKAAYDEAVARLSDEIADGTARFAFLMVDLNNLKKINDTYGHENGNRYILGACSILRGIFRSPIFRIGGDEFVVLLQGEEFERRTELIAQMRARFDDANSAANPWERYSAAAGMAEYQGGETVEQVFRRADDAMYQNKREMKAGRV